MTATIDDLQAENAWLKERIADLTGGDMVTDLKSDFGLTTQEARLLAMLVRAGGRTLSQPLIYAEVFEDPATGDGPVPKIVHIVIHRVRAKFATAGMGLPIETVWGAGYRAGAAALTWAAARKQEIAA